MSCDGCERLRWAARGQGGCRSRVHCPWDRPINREVQGHAQRYRSWTGTGATHALFNVVLQPSAHPRTHWYPTSCHPSPSPHHVCLCSRDCPWRYGQCPCSIGVGSLCGPSPMSPPYPHPLHRSVIHCCSLSGIWCGITGMECPLNTHSFPRSFARSNRLCRRRGKSGGLGSLNPPPSCGRLNASDELPRARGSVAVYLRLKITKRGLYKGSTCRLHMCGPARAHGSLTCAGGCGLPRLRPN